MSHEVRESLQQDLIISKGLSEISEMPRFGGTDRRVG